MEFIATLQKSRFEYRRVYFRGSRDVGTVILASFEVMCAITDMIHMILDPEP